MKILERIAKLIDVKSLMTLTLTGIFAYITITGAVDAEKFLTIFTMIVSFYFGTQAMKKDTIIVKNDRILLFWHAGHEKRGLM